MLCDYGAFDEEEPWVKIIAKTICDKNIHQQLSAMRLPDRNHCLTVHNTIYRLSNLYGYQADKVSAVLHKLALGLGSVDLSFDWDGEFTPSARTGSISPSAKSTSKATCPGCGRAYYKIYSAYCAFCGRKR